MLSGVSLFFMPERERAVLLRQRLVDDRLDAWPDVQFGEVFVPPVGIYPVAQENENQFVVGVDPETGAGETGVSVDRCRCFGADRTDGRIVRVGFVKSQSPPAVGTFGAGEVPHRGG